MLNSALVLVVEDDNSVRITLTELLKMYDFKCIAATNGVEAFEELAKQLPDIILCDVNMPVMGGNEFTTKLRTKLEYAHIPVIMLTANVAEEDMIKGLKSGAVDYIKKPFNNNELILKINNILSTKRALHSYSWQSLLSNSFEENPNIDEQFVQGLYELILENIDDSGYSVQQLADEMNMSERNLYRKVKELIGMPVASFIREVRLQCAHDLLSKNKVKTFSEAASKVGFKSSAYFTRLYKEKFG